MSLRARQSPAPPSPPTAYSRAGFSDRRSPAGRIEVTPCLLLGRSGSLGVGMAVRSPVDRRQEQGDRQRAGDGGGAALGARLESLGHHAARRALVSWELWGLLNSIVRLSSRKKRWQNPARRQNAQNGRNSQGCILKSWSRHCPRQRLTSKLNPSPALPLRTWSLTGRRRGTGRPASSALQVFTTTPGRPEGGPTSKKGQKSREFSGSLD